MRRAIVVCVYFGARRAGNCNPREAEVAGLVEEHKERCPSGWDLWFVVNGEGEVDWPRVIYRDNDGGPFAAYAEWWRLHGEGVERVVLLEDDVMVTDPSWYSEASLYIEECPAVGMVALSPIVKSPQLHAGGGVGMYRGDALRAVVRDKGALTTCRGASYGALEAGEMEFTWNLIESGYDLAALPGVSSLSENWREHGSMARWGVVPSGRFVYRSGPRKEA